VTRNDDNDDDDDDNNNNNPRTSPSVSLGHSEELSATFSNLFSTFGTLLGQGDWPGALPLPTQDRHRTDTHVSSEIRTHDPNRLTSKTDAVRLGQCDRQCAVYYSDYRLL
jgi:hypothetical protein